MTNFNVIEKKEIIMNQRREAAMKMASLSIYKGIMNRTVPKAFYRLLWADTEQEFLNAWGAFFAVLCERGFSDNFAECLTQTAMFDENAFALEATEGKTEFTPQMMYAVERDLQVILDLSRLTPDDLLEDCDFEGAFRLELPRWGTGEPITYLRGDIHDCIEQMRAYYHANGCGMYARYRAFIWRDKKIEPVAYPDKTHLSDLKGYELQRKLAIDNTLAFLQGFPANNCLLYGDRGTGKSSTVKALLNEYYPRGLRMIEMPKEFLMDFPALVDQIAALPMKFIIFIDDLSFSRQDDTYAALKAVLEGGLAARPENALIYATSNRRHLVRETFSDREGDEVHKFDTIQESLSLADRFGLSINFSLPDKVRYLEIVRKLAKQRGLEQYTEELERCAEQWATARGGRSPRCAKQFIDDAEARLKRGEPLED